MKNPRLLTLAIVVLAFAWSSAPGKAAAPPFTVVMSGLDNPRGLTFGKDGALYVAEAGRGGSGPCRVVRGVNQCYGPSGAVSRLRQGVQERIVTGLPSYAPQPSGAGATGPHDVSLPGRRQLYVPLGLGGPDAEAIRAFFDRDFGWLIRADEDSGSWERVADVTGYEFAANPDGGALDSNPYGLLPKAGGIVVDAGGNSLVRVSGKGKISTIAVFPSRAQGRVTDAVPTSVARGRDGAYYVGELTGAPFFAGLAGVYRVRLGQAPEVFLGGFTAIIDLTFGPDGSLYVLQFATGPGLSGPGALIRVAPDGTRTVIASEGLVAPTSVVIAPVAEGDEDDAGDDDDDDDGDEDEEDGPLAFYVSNCGVCAGAGQVIRIDP